MKTSLHRGKREVTKVMKTRPLTLFNIALATTLLTSLLLVGTIPSSGVTEYDPWCDYDDDGDIDIYDIVNIASRYGTTGTPVNKTELLLELQKAMQIFNGTICHLQANITMIDSTIASMRKRFVTQNATHSSVIYHLVGGSPATWQLMPNMTVKMNLQRTSFLKIIFSGKVGWDNPPWLRVLVDSNTTVPDEIRLEYGSYFMGSLEFYSSSVPSGVHTIELQYQIQPSQAIRFMERTLIVEAIPAP
jgi:hypothetical protein